MVSARTEHSSIRLHMHIDSSQSSSSSYLAAKEAIKKDFPLMGFQQQTVSFTFVEEINAHGVRVVGMKNLDSCQRWRILAENRKEQITFCKC